MRCSAPRFNGKLKREIADEAFVQLGKTATVQQVDDYFRKFYKLPFCERSMYGAAKRKAEGKPVPRRLRYARYKQTKIASIIDRIKQLASDLGGWEELEEIIEVLK